MIRISICILSIVFSLGCPGTDENVCSEPCGVGEQCVEGVCRAEADAGIIALDGGASPDALVLGECGTLDEVKYDFEEASAGPEHEDLGVIERTIVEGCLQFELSSEGDGEFRTTSAYEIVNKSISVSLKTFPEVQGANALFSLVRERTPDDDSLFIYGIEKRRAGEFGLFQATPNGRRVDAVSSDDLFWRMSADNVRLYFESSPDGNEYTRHGEGVVHEGRRFHLGLFARTIGDIDAGLAFGAVNAEKPALDCD